MAANMRPAGGTPFRVRADASISTTELPNDSRPSASASLRAGSTVSTRTRRLYCEAANAPSAADMVVFPTPPLPVTTTRRPFSNTLRSELIAARLSTPASWP